MYELSIFQRAHFWASQTIGTYQITTNFQVQCS